MRCCQSCVRRIGWNFFKPHAMDKNYGSQLVSPAAMQRIPNTEALRLLVNYVQLLLREEHGSVFVADQRLTRGCRMLVNHRSSHHCRYCLGSSLAISHLWRLPHKGIVMTAREPRNVHRGAKASFATSAER